MSNEQILKAALSRVLSNVTNYPSDAGFWLLGRDMSEVIDKSVDAVLGTGLIETVDSLLVRPQVTRVEVIDGAGRAFVCMHATDVETCLQDGGRTLKVFLREGL